MVSKGNVPTELAECVFHHVAIACGPLALAHLRRAERRLANMFCLRIDAALWSSRLHADDNDGFLEEELEWTRNGFAEEELPECTTEAKVDAIWSQLVQTPPALDITPVLQEHLHDAICGASYPLVEVLLEARADPGAFHETGARPPLLLAVTRGMPRIAQALLRAGANPDLAGVTAHSRAYSCGCYKTVERPLLVACCMGSLPLVEILLGGRANVNLGIRTESYDVITELNPLLVACDRAQPDIFSALIQAGADPDYDCEDPNTETGSRSVRETLHWMMGCGDERQFSSFGEYSLGCSDNVHRMFDAIKLPIGHC